MGERIIEFEGIRNFRDIGGYRARDGRPVRWGAVYRSGDFSMVTDADLERLAALGIRTVLDLRGADDVERKPDRIRDSSSLRTLNLPMWTLEMERMMAAWSAVRNGGVTDDIDPTELYLDVYTSMARDCSAQIRAVLEQLSDPQNLPAVIHCTAGKDRTGFVTSLLLTALGVSYEGVVQDYLLSNSCMHDWVEDLVAKYPNRDMVRRLLDARVEFLDAAYEM